MHVLRRREGKLGNGNGKNGKFAAAGRRPLAARVEEEKVLERA